MPIQALDPYIFGVHSPKHEQANVLIKEHEVQGIHSLQGILFPVIIPEDWFSLNSKVFWRGSTGKHRLHACPLLGVLQPPSQESVLGLGSASYSACSIQLQKHLRMQRECLLLELFWPTRLQGILLGSQGRESKRQG